MTYVRPRDLSRAPAGEQLVLEALYGATRAFRDRLRDELERERLSVPMFWALHHVVSDGPKNVGEIAEVCLVSSANVSFAVDDLVRDGLAVRERQEKDRRVVVLSATPRGRAVHRTVWTNIGRLFARSSDDLPASDISAAARVLNRFAQLAREPSRAPELLAP